MGGLSKIKGGRSINLPYQDEVFTLLNWIVASMYPNVLRINKPSISEIKNIPSLSD